MSAEVRPPRPAASLVVVRDGDARWPAAGGAGRGIEVLLMMRTERGDHNSGAWVFPGGIVDRRDRDWHCCTGVDDAAISQRLALDEGGLDYAIAAIRECFEEAGVLFADDRDGQPVSPAQWQSLLEWRKPLHANERTLGEMCATAGLRLAVEGLAYIAHWLTPLGRPKRYDTRFFIAAMPEGQVVAHDDTEIVDHRWMRPADALAQAAMLKLMTPTQAILRSIAAFGSVDALMRHSRESRPIPRIFPRIAKGRDGARPVTPDEPSYAEIARIDPEGRGSASYDIQVDVPVVLSERVIRVTANNGSVMTGPGTNAYLVRGENDAWAVIDPGPHDPSHVDAIVAAAPGPIRWIFVTHTHVDHSPAVVRLKELTGAIALGRVARFPDRQDPTFVPDRIPEDGERFKLGSSTTLRAVLTPGHASNHLCYLLEEEKTLFTGDHVMQGSTVVINPPDGDMAAYLASLRALSGDPGPALEWIAPGHGFLIEKPVDAFEKVIRHRLKREAKVVAAIERLWEGGAVHEDSLLAAVYDDVPPRMLPVARRSLVAHLIKLRDDGVAREVAAAQWAIVR